MDSEPNLQKFIEEDWLTTTCHPIDNQLTTNCQPVDAPETETYREETETKTERGALPKDFKDLVFQESWGKGSLEGASLQNSWEKWKIHFSPSGPGEDWQKSWEKWALNERKSPAAVPGKESGEKTLTGDELLAQQLGAVVWLREHNRMVMTDQARDFAAFERLSGIKVTWRNNREWKEQGAIPLNHERYTKEKAR